MVNNKYDGKGYERKYYNEITELVNTSELITSSDSNSNIFLRAKLVAILKKCLNMSMDERYQSCTELANDLNEALSMLYPAEINESLPKEMKLALIEKELDKKKGAGAYLTLMYHLYKNPLFECEASDSDQLNALIVGFGNYGQHFLDCCLQIGQLLGKKLNVTVVSDNKERDTDIYFSSRPAIRDFFSVDGSYCKDAYGQISFLEKELDKKDSEKNEIISKELAAKYKNDVYTFIALGDDNLNKDFAKAITKALAKVPNKKSGGSVYFAYEGEHIQGKVCGSPVYMADDVRKKQLFKDIERMAFNAHLIWESGLNIDLSKSFSKFKEPYNYKASISNVISIKYKLHSFGISMDDLTAAAVQCYQRITNASDDIKRELVALEHRRWVCEKICAGWTCKTNLNDCLTGETNDKKAKKHICLVQSTSQEPLQSSYWTKNKWDTATEEELEKLDDLDRMSVMLHQIYKREADRLRRESTLLDTYMLQLKKIVKKSHEASVAFTRWYSCLSLLWNGNDKPIKEYEKLKAGLIQASAPLNWGDFNTVKALVKIIDGRFSSILKSMRCIDYKNYDTELVNYIPFILTHKCNLHLAIPFSIGGNTEIFKNVAAPTVVNPKEITYLLYVNRLREVDTFKSAINYIINYMDEKSVTAKLNFIVAYLSDNEIRSALEMLEKELSADKYKERIRKIVKINVDDEADGAKSIGNMLISKFNVDGVEQNQAQLSVELAKEGFYEELPNYKFDINTRKFYDTQGCASLNFVKVGQHLNVSDMVSFNGLELCFEMPSSFYNDYETLWQDAYGKNKSAWKELCSVLSEHHRRSDIIAKFHINRETDENNYKKYRFLVPSEAYEGVSKIISAMVELGAFGKESEVYYYTNDSCEVKVYALAKAKAGIKALMKDAYVLSQPDCIGFSVADDSICVTFDYPKVENAALKTDGCADIKKLLSILEKDFAFITDYKEPSGECQVVSFSYATNRIKRLLTNEEDIFLVYAYHKCLKSSLFDDVKMSNLSLNGDFDMIVTKGFAGLVIKNISDEQDVHNSCVRLSAAARDIGINCKPVLIVDDLERAEMAKKSTDDVIVISNQCEIDEIDKTLVGLFNTAFKK